MPNIFDNINQRLLPALQQTLETATHADFCVGYFNLRGWKGLGSYIENLDGGEGACCRLLVGMQRLPEEDLRRAKRLDEQDDGMDNKTAHRLKQELAMKFRQQLLTLLLPKETALLANYPNPFNPETWIPYQLATPADVTLTIYAVDGTLVRTLSLGHQAAGRYQSRSRAAYWEGRNAVGEPVASGVYFYTLTAGEYSATRKMLILK